MFKRTPRLNIDLFFKHFFPERNTQAENQGKRGASESSQSGDDGSISDRNSSLATGSKGGILRRPV